MQLISQYWLPHGHVGLRLQKLSRLQAAIEKTKRNTKAERISHATHCQSVASRTATERQRQI